MIIFSGQGNTKSPFVPLYQRGIHGNFQRALIFTISLNQQVTGLRFLAYLVTGVFELLELLFHSGRQRQFDFQSLLGGVLPNVLSDFVAQNLDPHMEQKWATLASVAGSVTSS
jgi:hypothetical protein